MIIISTTSFPLKKDDHAGHFVLSQALGLSHSSEPVTIVAPAHPESNDSYLPDHVAVHRFKWPGWQSRINLAHGNGILENIRSSPRLALQLPLFVNAMCKTMKTLARKQEISGIISNWLIPAGLVCPIKSTTPANHIAIAHGSDVHLLSRLHISLRRTIIRRIAQSHHHIIAVSTDIRSRLLDMDSQQILPQITVVPMGAMPLPPTTSIRPTTSSISRQGPLQILFMGRLIPVKGVDILIKAVKKLTRPAILHIAGDGPMRTDLEHLCHHLGVKCHFHGHLDAADKSALIHDCHLAVIPSVETVTGHTEGTPTVFLEFLSHGIPVIASDTGGLKDLGHHLKNCILSEPGNPSSLMSAMFQLESDSALREKIIDAGYKTASRYDWRHITSTIRSLLSSPV